MEWGDGGREGGRAEGEGAGELAACRGVPALSCLNSLLGWQRHDAKKKSFSLSWQRHEAPKPVPAHKGVLAKQSSSSLRVKSFDAQLPACKTRG